MTDHPQPADGLGEPPPSGPATPRAAPVIHGENAFEYEDTVTGVLRSIKPADILEEAWARDVANLIWETRRLSRLKATLIRTATRQAMENTLRPIIYSDRQPGSDSKDYPNWQVLSVGWAAGERAAVERVEKLLGSVGMSAEAVAAQAMASRFNDIERIDRTIAIAEQRRIALLREIEAHRLRLARTPERAAREIGRAGDAGLGGGGQAAEPQPGAQERRTA
jgi:hypothetical protein